jgi:hypothetical protein
VAIFVQDSFTESSDVTLANHTGETGATWTVHSSGADNLRILAADDFVKPASSGTTSPAYYASGTPGAAEYTVKADIVRRGAGSIGAAAGVTGRGDTSANTLYLARYNGTAGQWQMFKIVAGTSTSLGTYSQTLTVSQAYEMTFDITDSAKRLLVDGVERISSSDNVITAAGKAGTRWLLNSADQFNMTMDNVVAEDGTGGGSFKPAWASGSNTIIGSGTR